MDANVRTHRAGHRVHEAFSLRVAQFSVGGNAHQLPADTNVIQSSCESTGFAKNATGIRTTLERRQALLDAPQPQASLFDSAEMDEWAELDGQSQVDIAVQTSGWVQEKAEVDLLLTLARETEAQGTDAKAEALLELIYKLQQEENDPTMKVLIFTEFVPTQAMLAGFLESRGFSVALLNGSMDLDTLRLLPQQPTE